MTDTICGHRTDYEIACDSLTSATKAADDLASELDSILALLLGCVDDQKQGWRSVYEKKMQELRAAERYVGECQSRRSQSAMPIGYTGRR